MLPYSTCTNPVEEKRRLRERMRALRLVADQEGADAALALVRHVVLPALPELRLEDGAVFAGYWPIATEIDVRPLLARLHDRGFRCALPAIVVGEPFWRFVGGSRRTISNWASTTRASLLPPPSP